MSITALIISLEGLIFISNLAVAVCFSDELFLIGTIFLLLYID
jgi:hypothetical protein